VNISYKITYVVPEEPKMNKDIYVALDTINNKLTVVTNYTFRKEDINPEASIRGFKSAFTYTPNQLYDVIVTLNGFPFKTIDAVIPGENFKGIIPIENKSIKDLKLNNALNSISIMYTVDIPDISNSIFYNFLLKSEDYNLGPNINLRIKTHSIEDEWTTIIVPLGTRVESMSKDSYFNLQAQKTNYKNITNWEYQFILKNNELLITKYSISSRGMENSIQIIPNNYKPVSIPEITMIFEDGESKRAMPYSTGDYSILPDEFFGFYTLETNSSTFMQNDENKSYYVIVSNSKIPRNKSYMEIVTESPTSESYVKNEYGYEIIYKPLYSPSDKNIPQRVIFQIPPGFNFRSYTPAYEDALVYNKDNYLIFEILPEKYFPLKVLITNYLSRIVTYLGFINIVLFILVTLIVYRYEPKNEFYLRIIKQLIPTYIITVYPAVIISYIDYMNILKFIVDTYIVFLTPYIILSHYLFRKDIINGEPRRPYLKYSKIKSLFKTINNGLIKILRFLDSL